MIFPRPGAVSPSRHFGNNAADMESVPLSPSFHQVVFCDPRRRRGAAVTFDPRPKISPPPPHDGTELSHSESAWFRSIFRRAGLPMDAYKTGSLIRRRSACLRALGVSSITEARQLLANRPDRFENALSSLLIGVTDFFRDPRVFAALEVIVKNNGRPMRVWSAGCSNGAELYSIAILLDRLGLLAGSHLLGTDCRSDAVAQAAAGFYDMPVISAIPIDLRDQYCELHGSKFRIIERLRGAARFARSNLLAGIEPGAWDLILCRNLIIYLQPAVVGQLWTGFEKALMPGGLLMLGKAERPLGAPRLRPAGPMLWRRTEVT
jgi:chemotaxis protein methyltransferase CheR